MSSGVGGGAEGGSPFGADADSWEDLEGVTSRLQQLKPPSAPSFQQQQQQGSQQHFQHHFHQQRGMMAPPPLPPGRPPLDRQRGVDNAGGGGQFAVPRGSAHNEQHSASFSDPQADAIANARVDAMLRDALTNGGQERIAVLKQQLEALS